MVSLGLKHVDILLENELNKIDQETKCVGGQSVKTSI